jgi:hypothetical protein
MIDHQVDHIHSKSLVQLGDWMAKQYKRSVKTKYESELIIQNCGINSEILEAEWKAQVYAQTKPMTGEYILPYSRVDYGYLSDKP